MLWRDVVVGMSTVAATGVLTTIGLVLRMATKWGSMKEQLDNVERSITGVVRRVERLEALTMIAPRTEREG